MGGVPRNQSRTFRARKLGHKRERLNKTTLQPLKKGLSDVEGAIITIKTKGSIE